MVFPFVPWTSHGMPILTSQIILTQTTLSLHELVNDGGNGRVFETAPQLATQLEVHLIFFCDILNSHDDSIVKTLLAGFPDSPSLRKLASSLERAPATPNPHVSTNHGSQESQMWCTWEENWGRVMRPLILHDVNF